MADLAGLSLRVRHTAGAFELEAELSASPGETLVLIGPSGSGKSTCLRLIAGLLRPRKGAIAILGRTVLDTERGIDLPPWKRRTGFVFQDYALFPHLTVMQNVLYGAAGRRAEALRWLELLGVADLAGGRPRQLSGGQQQRVALARAAATDTDLLLLDEPFGSLDAATRRSVRGELRRFLREAGRTAVLVSHDPLDALTLGDRIAVLEEGRVTQQGTRTEVLHRPRTPFLAALTGHNVLEGTLGAVESGGDLREVRCGPVTFHAAGAPDLPAGPVFLSFRPEDVTLLPHDPGIGELTARNRLRARITEVLELTDRLRVYLDAGVPLMADVVRSAASELHLHDGSEVVAAVKATAIEVYR
jgi:molybdate transport system ATP-binding protein